MKKNLTVFLLVSCYFSAVCAQGTFISSGTRMTGYGGTTIFYSDLTNDGNYSNSLNTVVFAGDNQKVGGNNPAGFDNLTIESGSTVNSVDSGFTVRGSISCNGLLNSSGNVVLLSDASGTAFISGSSTGQITGTITMQRYLQSGYGYKYFSSPFQDATVNGFSDDIDLSSAATAVYRYDENRTSSGWVNYKATTNPLVPATGYAVNMGNNNSSNTVDLSGKVNSGSVSLTLYNHNYPNTKGFNLVGNPYPSPIDWDAADGWTKVNIDDAIYYFNASSSDQYSGTYSTYKEGISSDGIASNIIPSMQGFFVHVSDGTFPVSGTLGFTNEVRVADKQHSFAKSASKGETSLIRMVAGYTNNDLSYDPFVVYNDNEATFNFDGQLDALKLFNTDQAVTNFYVFADDGNRLSINAIPDAKSSGCVLRLGIKTYKNGEIEFKIRDISGIYLGETISIFDAVTGNSTELADGQSYKVNLPAGDYQNRFYLNIGGMTTGTDDIIVPESGFRAWFSSGTLITETSFGSDTKGTVYVHNLAGQVLFTGSIISSGYNEFYPALKEGLYLVSYVAGDIRISRKVVFRR